MTSPSEPDSGLILLLSETMASLPEFVWSFLLSILCNMFVLALAKPVKDEASVLERFK